MKEINKVSFKLIKLDNAHKKINLVHQKEKENSLVPYNNKIFVVRVYLTFKNQVNNFSFLSFQELNNK